MFYLLIAADVSMESGNRIRLSRRQREPEMFLRGCQQKASYNYGGERHKRQGTFLSRYRPMFLFYYKMCLETLSDSPEKNLLQFPIEL